MPTSFSLNRRARSLTEEQAKYVVQNLKWIPIRAEAWKMRVPYIYQPDYDGDVCTDERMIPYNVSEYDSKFVGEDIEDYILRAASFYADLHEIPRTELENIRATHDGTGGIRVSGYKIDWPYEKVQYSNGVNSTQFLCNNTSIPNNYADQVFADFYQFVVAPLAMFVPAALGHYSLGEVGPEGVPHRWVFVGRDSSSIMEVWKELGGTVEYHNACGLLPNDPEFYLFRMDKDLVKDYQWAVYNMSYEWRYKIAEWNEEAKSKDQTYFTDRERNIKGTVEDDEDDE